MRTRNAHTLLILVLFFCFSCSNLIAIARARAFVAQITYSGTVLSPLYIASNLSIGTPPQPQQLLISTDATSHSWVKCGRAGPFDPSKSSTFQYTICGRSLPCYEALQPYNLRGRLAKDVFSLRSTNGSSQGALTAVQAATFACTGADLGGLGFKGLASFTGSKEGLPAQLGGTWHYGAAAIVAEIPAPEVDALLQFKAYLSVPSQALLRGWHANNTLSVCGHGSWVGVTCDVSTLHIQGLNLSGFGLAGSIAPHLGNLTFLSSLDLSHNFLRNCIPQELSSCSFLRGLDLGNNNLTGLIPASFSFLSSLQSLRLHANSLTGHIPQTLLTNCTSLHVLSLHGNKLTGPIPTPITIASLQQLLLYENNLTGSIPPSLGNQTQLVKLQLDSNQLTGAIPSELGLLHRLQSLILSFNSLIGATIPRSLGNCTEIFTFFVDSNYLSGTIPEELGAISALLYLSLFQNDLEGEIPKSLANCTGIRILQLNSNPRLAGPIPIEVGRLQSLKRLVLWGNNHTGFLPSSLGNCTSLTYLLLSNNDLTGSIPSELAKLQQLQILELSYNKLSGAGLEMLKASNLTSLWALSVGVNKLVGSLPGQELAQLQQLEVIELGYNQFSNDIPWGALTNCSSLGSLGLAGNRLTGGIPSTLGKLRSLQYLHLTDNFLSGALPNDAHAYQSLRLLELDMSSNELNGSLPTSLAQALTSLETRLDLSHNLFSGALPTWLGSLVMVQTMDLSYNHLVGALPVALGACVGLSSLDLSHNHLTGSLPLQLENLTLLQTLDLSFNNLTGELPSFLGSLHHLHYLNVSFNNFTGAVPLHGVFQQHNASFLEGNPGLCGPSVHKSCPQQPSEDQQHHHGFHFTHKSFVVTALVLTLMLVVGVFTASAVIYYYREIAAARMVDYCSHEMGLVKWYSAQELHEATQGYSEDCLLGEGGLAIVYKAVLSDGKVVAVKKLKDLRFRETLLKEVQILGKLRHANLVHILGCVLNLEVHVLMMEYMSNGTLERYMRRIEEEHEGRHRLSMVVLLNLCLGVANALTYLHHEFGIPIIHGDVKPSNILLDSEFEAHLADFGLAKLVGDTGTISLSSNFMGSIGYMAPEYASSVQITTKVDVYSFGVVVLEMLTGKRPTSAQFSGSERLHDWVRAKLLADDNAIGSLHASLYDNIASSSSVNLNASIAKQLLIMGLACTKDKASERPTMQEIRAALFDIKKNLINTERASQTSDTHGIIEAM